jgi:hypothetical protein
MLLYLVFFLMGYCTALLVMYILSFGRAVMLLKSTMQSSAFLFAHVEQVYNEASEYRSKCIDQSGLSMREKLNRKTLDRNIVREMKKAAIKGYLEHWPDSFSGILEFKDWDSMTRYVEGQLKIIRRLK